jgi:hypothetical protein
VSWILGRVEELYKLPEIELTRHTQQRNLVSAVPQQRSLNHVALPLDTERKPPRTL